jgi:hypothetical protein
MPTKLTEAQRALLQAGAQREDRFIPAPSGSKGAAAKKSATKLIAEGLAKEVKATSGVPIWRIDGETGQAYALKLTAAGFKTASAPSGQGAETNVESLAKERPVEPTAPSNHEMEASGNTPSALTSFPREGSKLAAVVTLLKREGGVTIDELANATGWLPHTTRAALTALRKRGLCIDRIKATNQRASSYIVVGGGAQADSAQG